MQIVHATFHSGEGEEAVKLLSTLGVDIEDYKLIKSESGDLLIINLLYGDTDVLLDNLTSRFDFENDDERSLIIFTPDTVIPRSEEKLKKASFHASRESLITYAQKKSQVSFEYILLIIFSSIITSLGLILDNVAVIVGGMVIAPVLGPILAITIGIVLGNTSLIRKGIAAEILAVVFAVLVGVAFGFFIPNVEINNSLRIRMFPTMADLFIAMAAGAAGAYALIRGQLESGLVGVMVAAALLPVMSTIGIGISMANQTMILGSFLLLGGNYLSLLLANIVVFYFEGLRPQIWYKHKADKIIKKSLLFIIIAVILLSVPLSILTVYQFFVEKPDEIIMSTIRENLVIDWDYRIESVEISGNLVNIFIYAEKEIDQSLLLQIKEEIETKLIKDYNLNFKIIPIKEIKM